MIQVEQRYTYDCLTACLASIFEEPYESVPIFCDKDTGKAGPFWYKTYERWLEERGFAFIQRVLQDGDQEGSQVSPWRFPGYWIAGVVSPRVEGDHAVVMHWGDLVWDPHPRRDMGHKGFTSADYFLPLDPAKLKLVD